MEMIRATMAFVVAMTILMILAVKIGVFDALQSWAMTPPSVTSVNVNVAMPDGGSDGSQPQVILVEPDGQSEPIVVAVPEYKEESEAKPTARPVGVPFLKDVNDGVTTPNEFKEIYGWGPDPVTVDDGCGVMPPLACPTP